MHMLSRVRELEETFSDSVTVIGVHAGKFSTERHTDRIAEACDRLRVQHAVVNDRQFRIWHDYAVNAWPTVVVIDPEGRVALVARGEFSVGDMSAKLATLMENADRSGVLVRGPDPVAVSHARHEGPLRFPSRAVAAQGHLWVADTGHGRVLDCTWEPGDDAAVVVAEHAGFVEPRGLATSGEHVYVADRDGQAIWRLDAHDRVRVAGTGRLGVGPVRPGPGVKSDLRSPWGLAMHGRQLAVTMAGSHQMWMFDMEAGLLALAAGTGAEDIGDGIPALAALAQPTGVALVPDGRLAFADCESSAVRILGERVETIVGTGLFQFGDRPGVGDAALLQHCEDVAVHGPALAVADTYNDRIKLVDPETRECVPWPGEAGESGSLREPGGVWSDGSTLLVADTGHHRLVALGLDGALREIELA